MENLDAQDLGWGLENSDNSDNEEQINLDDLKNIALKAQTDFKDKKEKEKQNKIKAIEEYKEHKKQEQTEINENNKRKLNEDELSQPQRKKRKITKTRQSIKFAKPSPATINKMNNQRKIIYDMPIEKQRERSVLRLSNMPAGFEEPQIEAFFTQFGVITRYCLKRHRFGRTLRRAYIEFNDSETAEHAAEAIDGMILYNHMLQAHVLEPEKVSGAIFKTNNLNMARKYKKYEIAKLRWHKAANIANCEMQDSKWLLNLLKDEDMIRSNLESHGIKYDFPGIREIVTSKMPEAMKELESNKNQSKNENNLSSFLE